MTYLENLSIQFFLIENKKQDREFLIELKKFLKLNFLGKKKSIYTKDQEELFSHEYKAEDLPSFRTSERGCGIYLSVNSYSKGSLFQINFSNWKYVKELHEPETYKRLASIYLQLVKPSNALSSNLGAIDFEGDLSLDFNTLKLYKNLNDNSEPLIFNEMNYFSNELLAKHDNKAFFESFEQLVRIPFAEGWLSIDKKGIFAEVLPEIQELAAKLSAQNGKNNKST